MEHFYTTGLKVYDMAHIRYMCESRIVAETVNWTSKVMQDLPLQIPCQLIMEYGYSLFDNPLRYDVRNRC